MTMEEVLQNAQAFGKNILCFYDDAKKDKKSSLIITNPDKNEPIIVKAISVGNDVNNRIAEGNRILIRPYAGYVVHTNGSEKWLMVNESEAMLVWEDNKEQENE